MLELALVFCLIAALAPVFGAIGVSKSALVLAVVCLTLWAVGGLLVFASTAPVHRRVLRHA